MRFDVPVTTGVNEVACVCPRCGTPFTHEVPEGAETVERMNPHADTSVSGMPAPPLPPRVEQPSNTASAPATGNVSQDRETRHQTSWQQRLKYATQGPPNVPVDRRRQIIDSVLFERSIHPQHHGKRSGCIPKGCFLLIFVILLLFAYSVYVYVTSNSYTAEDVIEDISMVEQDVSEREQFVVKDKEQTPEWLEGRWEITTRSGRIIIFIKDDKISELSGNDDDGIQASHGTFYYSKGILHCNFEDADMEELRRVDVKRKSIDAGVGLWMRKTSGNV